MNLLLAMMHLLQIVGTPVAGGALVVSNESAKFPELPANIEPIPINKDWELLYYEVYSGSSSYSIRGEIRNTSTNPLSTPTLIITFADGSQLGVHPDVDQVASGERAPFNESVYEDEVTAALNQSQEIEFTGVCEDFYGVVPGRSLTWKFQDVEVEYNARRSAAQVSGSVTYTGDASVEGYAPMLFGFTEDGRYTGSISASDIPTTIFNGDVVPFEMNDGFDTFHSNDPFAGAGEDAILILAMAQPVYVSINCVG